MLENIYNLFVFIALFLDSIIYSLISWVYQIILVLCQVDILDNSYEITQLMNRLYIVIGVVVLFFLAYSLLKSMVNPDDALKNKKGPVAIIRDVIISIVLIALVPSIFSFAMGFQQSLLTQNTIGKLILGNSSIGGEPSETTIESGGIEIASNILQAFIHPANNECPYIVDEEGRGRFDCSKIEIATENTIGWIPVVGFFFSMDGGYNNYDAIWESIKDTGNFLSITSFAYSISHESVLSYYFIISTAVGIFVLLVLLSYCIDIAVRAVKLAVFQLIAPLPILARIMPNEQGGKVFSNWLKATLSTYLEVFIRLAILFFAVLLIKIVVQNLPSLLIVDDFLGGEASFTVYLFAQLFVIVGIIFFIKQAPGIIKDITGLDGGKYNVLKSAKQGLALIGGAAVGRSPAAAVRAWDEAGKGERLFDFSAIGHQRSRRLANAAARAQGAGIGTRVGDRMRKAFGMESLLERSDRNFETNRDLAGKYFTANNDTSSTIHLRDENGNIVGTLVNAGALDVEFSEETVQKLNEAKARNAMAVSRIAEQAKEMQNITEANKKSNVKGSAEELAKKEMAKGAFWLRDENGEFLSYTSTNGQTIGITRDTNGELIGWTQKQWEDWYEVNRERMDDAERARFGDILNRSINDYTVKSFYDRSGRNKDSDSVNKDLILQRQQLAQQLELTGVLDATGTVQHQITVEGKTINLDDLSRDPSQITFSDVKAIKNYVEDVDRQLAGQLNTLNHDKSVIEAENASITRMETQVKEKVESEKTSQKYTSYKAASDANKMSDAGKK